MAKNKITVTFRLFSVFSVLMATALSRLFQILYMWAYSDITVSEVFTHIFNYSHELFSLFSVILAICCTVYAHAYFGKKTAVSTCFVSVGCLAAGKVMMYIYNILSNHVTVPQLISGAFTYFIEILFDALVIVIAMIFCFTFAKKRVTSERADADSAFSPGKTAVATLGAYVFILIADLTFMNVIPFLAKVDSVSAENIKYIVIDYLYYVVYLPVGILMIMITMMILRKLTGKLQLKKHYEKISANNN